MIEIPVFEGSVEQRLALLERFIVAFAEELNSRECAVISLERGRTHADADEITVTYTDGRSVRYLIPRVK